MFVTFEGGDGSGKSTQSETLAARLRREGHLVTTTFEPGGTPLGMALRTLLLNSLVEIDALPQVLLFATARSQNVESVIKPALKEGSIVICDRFVDSTLAYQGYGRRVNLKKIRTLNQIASNGIVPDLTVLLDIDPAVSLKRMAAEGDRIGGHLQLGFELGDPLAGHRREGGWELELHQRIRNGYLRLAAGEPKRWLTIDASKPVEEVADIVWERVETLLRRDVPKPANGSLL